MAVVTQGFTDDKGLERQSGGGGGRGKEGVSFPVLQRQMQYQLIRRRRGGG